MNNSMKNPNPVGRLPSAGVPPRDSTAPSNAASGDAGHNPVGRLPSAGASPSDNTSSSNAASGDAAYKPAAGAANEPPPRRLRRLHRVWPDRDGNISYLLTLCVDGRARVLDNQTTFDRLVSFLLDSPKRYHWFGRRFVVMPDHIHLIAHQGPDAVRLGQWIKALKAVVGGLERREERPVGIPGPQDAASGDAGHTPVGRLPSAGVPPSNNTPSSNAASGDAAYKPPGRGAHEFTRPGRTWRWQNGFHDHKFRTPESEARKWEYVCLNPVRAGLVKRPEEWPFGGEIFYDQTDGHSLICGTPPLLEVEILVEKGTMPPQPCRPAALSRHAPT